MAAKLGRLVPSQTALFVCDVQERFRPIISGFDAVVDVSRRMIRGATALDIPVVVTEQYPKALGSTVSELHEVLPESALVAKKMKFSMVVPEVQEALQQRRGITQSALDLIEHGYEVHLVVDGVSSKRTADRAVAIQRLSHMGAFLVQSEMALFQLMGTAEHPAFKAISSLAKEERPNVLSML